MKFTLLLLLSALPVLLHLVAAAMSSRGHRDAAWRRGEAAAIATMIAGAAALATVLTTGPLAGLGLRLDFPGALTGLLVGFVAWAIVRFSHRYLLGEQNERRYLRLLAGTLAAVSLVLAADNLLLLAGAWIATSVTLHGLLCFYAGRPAARLAAHKKIIAARCSDAALLGAVALLGFSYGTLSLAGILERAASIGVPVLAQAGLVLLVVTALLKCAQLPVHGWLLQVMEAPTPVSALLHAGVVNLGGLVLIRFAPLLSQSTIALVVLAVFATATVLIATLVMGTRISVKVALAWSTVAQMGFMLLQVALGLPAMALLHLVAHSLYKAHAFLAAGGVVARQQSLRLAAPLARSPVRWTLAAIVLPSIMVGAGAASGALTTPAAGLAAAVLGLALVPLAASGRLGAVAAVALGWFGAHELLSLGLTQPEFHVPLALTALVALALALLFMLQAVIVLRPTSSLVRRLYPWAYGGFYIDEQVTRALLRRWPLPTDVHPVPAVATAARPS